MVMQRPATRGQQIAAGLPDDKFPLIEAYAASELPFDRKAQIRRDAQNAVLARLLDLTVVTDPTEAIVHAIYPNDDLGIVVGGLAVNRWLTAAMVIGTELLYVNAAVLGQTKVMSVYGFSTDSTTPGVAFIRFSKGPAGLNTLGRYQLQKVWTMLETYGFFSKTMIWDRNERVTVGLMPFVANASENFVIQGYVAEPVTEQVAGAVL